MNRKLILLAAGAVSACTIIALNVVPASGQVSHPATVASSSPKSSGGVTGTAHFLTLAAAQKVADAALRNCQQRGFAVTVPLLDRDGLVIVQERGDGATGATVNVSEEKAYAAVGFQSPTSALQQAATPQPGFTAIPGFVILPGGLPISVDGGVVAGIGVSGTPSGDTDAACAQVGIDQLS
ncbi:MAG TPA: heme-binding protein [Pseudonocardiaceae bacterium]|nr:heme-binding protein [Pseudonocardiaceae bacterium]